MTGRASCRRLPLLNSAMQSSGIGDDRSVIESHDALRSRCDESSEQWSIRKRKAQSRNTHFDDADFIQQTCAVRDGYSVTPTDTRFSIIFDAVSVSEPPSE